MTRAGGGVEYCIYSISVLIYSDFLVVVINVVENFDDVGVRLALLSGV